MDSISIRGAARPLSGLSNRVCLKSRRTRGGTESGHNMGMPSGRETALQADLSGFNSHHLHNAPVALAVIVKRIRRILGKDEI